MENFFYEEEFYSDLGDLMDDIVENEDLSDIAEDWSINCRYGILEPIVLLSPDWIIEHINEERFTEDGDEHERIYELLKDIDFSTINDKMPKLWYPKGEKFIITKQDLVKWC